MAPFVSFIKNLQLMKIRQPSIWSITYNVTLLEPGRHSKSCHLTYARRVTQFLRFNSRSFHFQFISLFFAAGIFRFGEDKKKTQQKMQELARREQGPKLYCTYERWGGFVLISMLTWTCDWVLSGDMGDDAAV